MWLKIREAEGELEMWAGDTRIAVHPLLRGKGEQSVQIDHLQGLWNLTLRGKG